MSQHVEVEVLQAGDLLLCPPAHEADGAGGFNGPVRPEAHEGQAFIRLRRGLRSGLHVDLVIGTVLFLDLLQYSYGERHGSQPCLLSSQS